jgi:hypothetical protein
LKFPVILRRKLTSRTAASLLTDEEYWVYWHGTAAAWRPLTRKNN